MKMRSFVEVLAGLGAGAMLVACADQAAPPQVPAASKEVPAAATPATPDPAAIAASAAPAAPAMPAAPTAAPAVPSTPSAASAAAAVGAPAKPKAMPAKIKNSQRKSDKSAQGCCGEGTCAPC